MKRFFAGLLAVCLVGAAFAGCSGSSANYNVNDVASAVETVAKIENPLDITEDDLTYEFGVDMDKVFRPKNGRGEYGGYGACREGFCGQRGRHQGCAGKLQKRSCFRERELSK